MYLIIYYLKGLTRVMPWDWLVKYLNNNINNLVNQLINQDKIVRSNLHNQSLNQINPQLLRTRLFQVRGFRKTLKLSLNLVHLMLKLNSRANNQCKKYLDKFNNKSQELSQIPVITELKLTHLLLNMISHQKIS